MPLPRTMPPSPGRTRCKLPVLVSASNLPKVIVLDEEVKRAVNTSLERFHCSKQREMEFPSSLLSTERAYIHRLVETWGYMSKSKGEGPSRFLTVWKKNSLTALQSAMTLKMSPNSVHTLCRLLQRYPVNNKDRADLQVTSEFSPSATAADGSQGKNRSGRVNNGVPQVPLKAVSSALDDQHGSLPLHAYREKILRLVKENSVVVVVGETGSGKTTQIPQFLLDDCSRNEIPCRVFCAQPRRLASISAAERVAEERGEKVGQTVGYQIRLESRSSPMTLLTFCTNEVLLRTMMAGDDILSTVTHVIVDEVHERDGLTDFLLTKLKELVQTIPTLKLILSSAALDIQVFTRYFTSCQVINVQRRMFDVEQLFLEDIIKLINHPSECGINPNKKTQGEDPQGHLKQWCGTLDDAPQLEWHNSVPGKIVGVNKMDAIEAASLDLQIEADACISNIYSNEDPSAFRHLINLILNQNLGDYKHGKMRTTPLMIAAGQGSVRQMEKLLDLGARIHLTDSNGWTALDWAKNYQQKMAEDLLKSYMGGDPESLKEPRRNMELSAQDRNYLQDYHCSFKNDQIHLDIIVDLLHYICSSSDDGAVLIFLTGYDEIVALRDCILLDDRRFADNPERYQLFTLHSNMQPQDQQKAMQKSPEGVRKLILSTSIAETSITIKDVVFVIDSGKVKEKLFGSMAQVNWISKASVLQRMGRAGRCKPGMYFGLYSQAQFDNMTEFPVPQLQRMPMQELCLYTKLLVPVHCSVAEFLSKAPEPPHIHIINDAVQMLKNIEAMNPCEDLTDLGHHLADLSIDPYLGKMVLCAIVLKCLDPVLTIACTLANNEPFTLPTHASQKKAAILSRKWFAANTFSDHMALLRTFQAWQKARTDGSERSFCEKNFLSQATMEIIIMMRTQLLGQLRAIGFVRARGRSDIRDVNINSENWAIVKAALLTGTYPKLAYINKGSGSISRSGQAQISFHWTSVLSQPHCKKDPTAHGEAQSVQTLPTDWVIYDERFQMDRRPAIRCCSLVTPVTVAVFGGGAKLPSSALQTTRTAGGLHDSSDSEADEETSILHLARLKINEWIDFQLESETAKLVFQLRQKWHSMFLRRMRCPSKPLSQQDEATICALVSVLTAEEQALGLPQPTGIGQRPWPMLSEGSQEAPSSTSSSITALPNLGASQAPVCTPDAVMQNKEDDKERKITEECH
ncbi:3'-5' RNA helicase YTHDC2 isoform X2 [Gadus morhua]|uniref:3'-5' RNA helicase YTHDC2 isoform X2 n=1 Tax=Gadus morhua TaxID=8049 RepID=UPI0011B542CC|nr:3'-5' RNA helicase YTHDC2 isoform X2 [Gadus morhua]